MYTKNDLLIFSEATNATTESQQSEGTDLQPLIIPEGIPSLNDLTTDHINDVEISGESLIQGTPQEIKPKRRGLNIWKNSSIRAVGQKLFP